MDHGRSDGEISVRLMVPGTADSDVQEPTYVTIPLRPLGDRVVIKADVDDHAPTETASGLLVAKSLAAAVEGSDREDSWFVGTIVALGPKVGASRCPKCVPEALHVGDRVTFSWTAGHQVNVDGEKYLVMHASDVLAVVDEVNA